MAWRGMHLCMYACPALAWVGCAFMAVLHATPLRSCVCVNLEARPNFGPTDNMQAAHE